MNIMRLLTPEGTVACAILPVYSALDVTEDVVDAFSQSFSPFLLLERLGDRKPSAESGLERTSTGSMSNAAKKIPERFSEQE